MTKPSKEAMDAISDLEKHTPGPWARRPGYDDYKVVNADGWRIADCHDAPPRINGLANARLIAAAPELLEALERMRSVYPLALTATLAQEEAHGLAMDALTAAKEAQ